MLKEILVKDKSISLEGLNNFISLSNTYGVDNICLPSYFLKYVEVKDISIAAQIDFPYGLSANKTRAFETLYSISAGANFIDLTINPFLVENKMYSQIREEIKFLHNLCEDKRKELRAVIEYRLCETHLVDVCEVLCEAGINTVISSTGTMSDDPYDNLLMTNIIRENTPLNVIVTNVARSKEIYNMFKEELVYGLRSSDPGVIQEIFGVIK
jgi:deoxyribose-phosphate aldolase